MALADELRQLRAALIQEEIAKDNDVARWRFLRDNERLLIIKALQYWENEQGRVARNLGAQIMEQEEN